MSEKSTVEEVYLTPRREKVRCRLLPLPDRTTDAPAHPLLDLAPVYDEDSGRELLRLSVRSLGDGRLQDRTRAFSALDNEILAGVRLARAANGSPPVELSRLVGYHDDPAEPFALLEPYRGEPVEAVLRRRPLFEEERTAFRESLFRALFWLQACELVHRDIRPGTVRWDGEHKSVQLCGFTHTTVAGLGREAVGGGPWASHEQRKGSGSCDPRDDVWSAGLVLFQALSGHDVAGGGTLPLHEYPELEAQLKGVFAMAAKERPRAGELLERVSGAVPPHRVGVGDHLQQGRVRFRENRERKRAAAGMAPLVEADEEPRSTGEEPDQSTGYASERSVSGPAAPSEKSWDDGTGHGYGGRLVLLLLALVAVSVALFVYFG